MATTTKPTRIAVGSVRPGMTVRLASRKGHPSIGPEWIEVTDVKPEDFPDNKPGYRVVSAAGLYGHFTAATRMELQPEPVAKPEQPAKADKPAGEKTTRGPRTSVPLRTMLAKLITDKGERGEMTRKELHADPMVVVAAERRGWVTVDRSGSERAVDLVTLTDAGLEDVRRMGLVPVQ